MPPGTQALVSQTIDVAYRIHGDRIPLDHAYALYSAISRLPDTGAWLHQADSVGIQPIRGRYAERDTLSLNDNSRLRLRLPAEQLPQILPLVGQTIEIAGQRLRIGVPETRPLRAAAAIHAHLVTTRNGQDEDRFDAEVQRQLEALGIDAKATRGQRRVLRIRDKTVIGHALLITGLNAQASILLQEQGLGGRRKMGCGIFIRYRG